jgi:hydroxymethylpyrimidine pyrophosphatase-like HAD family hydrolase
MFSDILLTVDFDRTLTAPDSSIPQRNLEAIQYFMENGGAFTVNTGRSIPMSMGNIIHNVPVSAPLLLYNGSAAYDVNTKELSLCRPIDLDSRTVVMDIQNKFPGVTLEIQGIDAHYIFRKDEGWQSYCENNGCPWKYADFDNIPGPFLKFSFYGEFRENTVASMYEATPEELELIEEVISYIERTYGDKVEVFRSCPRIIDMLAKGSSKLRLARDLQKMLGRKTLICVGDAENDLAMLEGADFSFCPADGLVADRFENVCPCAEGAIADVIYNKIPDILQNKP